MRFGFSSLLTQPLVAIAGVIVALAAITATGTAGGFLPAHGEMLGALALAASLLIGVLIANQFPIYIRHNTKICVTSVPVFLMAALLPPTAAGITAGLAMFAGDFSVRAKRGTRLSDLVTLGARWACIGLTGSLLAHIATPSSPEIARFVPYLAAGVFMWAADILTLPIVLIPICHERASRIIMSAGREGGFTEASQYGLGILGVILALQQTWALALLLVPAGLVYLAFRKELDQDTFQLLENMADNVDIRGSYTNGHSRRVHELVAGILDKLDMHGQEAAQILTAARFHDLGKIGLPDQLLINPGSLTPEDRAMLESYPERGATLMAAYPDFSRGVEMVQHHHERWDGTGYPNGLSGTDIPFGARVIAVADSFEAMTSERPYRRALSVEQAADILRNGAGRQWDPTIVRAFLATLGQYWEQSGKIAAVESEAAVSVARTVTA